MAIILRGQRAARVIMSSTTAHAPPMAPDAEKQQQHHHLPSGNTSSHTLSNSDLGKEVPVSQNAEPHSEKPAVAAAPPAGPPGGPPGMSPPPNGGTTAWLQVVGSWMLFFNTWGILNTFGVCELPPSTEDLRQPSQLPELHAGGLGLLDDSTALSAP